MSACSNGSHRASPASFRHNTSTTTHPTTTTTMPATLLGKYGMQANWVIAENNEPGTNQWQLNGKEGPNEIDGYTNMVSAQDGDTVGLYVSTPAPSFYVEAFRMGWYQGTRGRLIWTSQNVQGGIQATCPLIQPVRMVECNWHRSLSINITAGWPPGDYLFKLIGSSNQQSWVPLTVRDDASHSTYLVQNSVTTWQAYNLYGGYDLYSGLSNGVRSYNARSYEVSFDRPYIWSFGNGSADFVANELPMVALVEKLGLDVSYTTNVDLSENPSILSQHKTLLSLGHDEYWSLAERNAVAIGINFGLNFLAFGANAIYRHIRFDSSPLGPFRREICYKSTLDPLYGKNNPDVTVNWNEPPDPRPPSEILGDEYSCNPVTAPMVIENPSLWIWANTSLSKPTSLPGIVGSEYDHVIPNMVGPTNIEILANSPVTCQGRSDYADATWYTAAHGGGVFDSGTNGWVGNLAAPCPTNSTICPSNVLIRATENLLLACAKGPASLSEPSVSNVSAVLKG